MKDHHISNRVRDMKPSATLQMAAAARELADAGVDVVALSAGEPDFTTPDCICEVGRQSISAGKTHYAPVRGTKNMVAAMREKFARDQKVNYSADEVLCTVGAKAAIYLALEAIVNEGDEVIIFSPYWVSYLEQIRLFGGKPVIVECRFENNFMPTKDDLAKVITNKTKAVILNSPNNPSGGVISHKQLSDIAQVLANTDIWLISDEIYEKLLFDKHDHISPASLNDDMKDRTIVISGASKAYAMTGWRVGVAAGHKSIISAMTTLQGQQTTSNPEFIQDAAAFALRENSEVQAELQKMLKAYHQRREISLNLFSLMPQVEVFRPQGAFYIWADFKNIIGKTINNQKITDDIDLATRMLKEAHVACVAGTPFGTPGFLRMSIASSSSDLEKALHRMATWLKGMSN